MAETSRTLSLPLLLLTWFLITNLVSTQCIESERSALLEIQRDIYDPHGKWLSSWRKGGDCCSSWHGVVCNNTTGHVIKLYLQNPYGHGRIYSIGPSKLNPALLRLSHLEYLDLSLNNFSGAPFPEFIGYLINLKYLDLTKTNFNGTIPPHLGNLSNLHTLNIYYTLPSLHVDDLHWLTKLTSLSQLMLGRIDLSKAVNWAYDISMLPALSDLVLDRCELSNIPAYLSPVNNFTFLTSIVLRKNNFLSTIPSWLLNNISSLVELHLDRSHFYGELPLASGQSSNLKDLDVSHNHITGSLPETLGNYSQLEYLVMSHNNMSGEIPESIGNLRNLVYFHLAHNQISGRIPNSIGNLQNLQLLFLHSNLIEGSIPDVVGNLNNLDTLYLSSNRLYGPMFFLNMSSLSILNLSGNYLFGRLPWYQNNSSQMESLRLSDNHLSGNIPDSFGSLLYLRSLHLDDNELSGGIPSSLKQCEQLFILDLGENNLSGNIPIWIGESLSSLGALILRSNQFSGSIPPQLSNLTSLQILDLSNNYLTGNLSLCFENFSAMITMHDAGDRRFQIHSALSIYNENLWLNVKGSTADYTKVLSAVTDIDLSSNGLYGEIPHGLTLLRGLCFLNLSRNHFTGKIPLNISAMIQLESLDLSTNNISGEIPSSMPALNFLSYLNLSNNHLSGTIPSGNQFFTFTDPSIYSGNKGLCGWPLPQCTSNAPSHIPPNAIGQEEEYEDETEMVWFATIGFVISYSTFIGVLIIKKSIRYAYFCAVDNLLDWIYVKFALNVARLKSTIVKMEVP